MKKIKINNFKEFIYHEKLNNGLNVYILPLKNKKIFASTILLNYGGRDISFKVNNKKHNVPTGIAHFLEHKMFEREISPFDFYNKYGTDVNAQTSDDYTAYYFIGTKGFKPSLIYLLNWIKSLEINENDVKKEQGIILEEANMYKDNPNSMMFKKVKSSVYVNDPKKNEVIGTDKDIVSITKKDLDLCYNTFYTPDNMSLIVTGNVNPKSVINIVKKQTKDLKKSKNKVERVYNLEPDTVNKKSETLKMNVGVPKICTVYKMNKNIFSSLKLSDIEFDLYLNILINISLGITSDIREKWLKENLFTTSSYRISSIDTHYIIEFYANSLYPDKLKKELENYLNNFQISKEDFEREKKTWIASEIRKIDNPIGLMYSIMDDIIEYKEFINNKTEIIKNLNFETLLKIKNTLSFENKSIVKVMPKK